MIANSWKCIEQKACSVPLSDEAWMMQECVCVCVRVREREVSFFSIQGAQWRLWTGLLMVSVNWEIPMSSKLIAQETKQCFSKLFHVRSEAGRQQEGPKTIRLCESECLSLYVSLAICWLGLAPAPLRPMGSVVKIIVISDQKLTVTVCLFRRVPIGGMLRPKLTSLVVFVVNVSADLF